RGVANRRRCRWRALQLGERMPQVATEALVEVRREEAVLLVHRTPTPVRIWSADPALVRPQQVVVLAEPHEDTREHPPHRRLGELIFLPVCPRGTGALGFLERRVDGLLLLHL